MKVDITLPEILDLMCEDCKAKLKDLVKTKLADVSIEEALKGNDATIKPSRVSKSDS